MRARYRRHLADSSPAGSPKQRWTDELARIDLQPVLEVLETVQELDAPIAEAWWTNHYARFGRLYNGPLPSVEINPARAPAQSW